MVCMGFKSVASGWKVQTKPRSYSIHPGIIIVLAGLMNPTNIVMTITTIGTYTLNHWQTIRYTFVTCFCNWLPFYSLNVIMINWCV